MMLWNKKKSKKGQIGLLIKGLIGAGLFIAVWLTFEAKVISDYAHQGVIDNNLTGLEALILLNLNPIIAMVLFIFIILLGYIVFSP